MGASIQATGTGAGTGSLACGNQPSRRENASARDERGEAQGGEQKQYQRGDSTTLADVSNTQFLRDNHRGHGGGPWATGIKTDPHDAAPQAWMGRQVRTTSDVPGDDVNAYFSVAAFRVGATRRLKDAVLGVMAVVLDDIDTDGLNDLPRYSWAIETSPHNYQVGYCLIPREDIARVDALLRAMTAAGHSVADKSGNSIARYVRLPNGINSKAAVIADVGTPFPTRLVEWWRERRFSVDELADAFGIDLATVNDRGPRINSSPETDDELREAVITCEAFHDPLVRIAARLIGRGMAQEEVVAVLTGLMDEAAGNLPDSARRTEWESRRAEIPRYVDSAARKYADPRTKPNRDLDPRKTPSKAADDDGGTVGQGGGDEGGTPLAAPVRASDFYAYMPDHAYLYVPTRELWPASSVNGRLKPLPGPDGKLIPPARWLDLHRPVEQMTWSPGHDLVIQDRLVMDGGWTEHPGATVFNRYLPPVHKPGDNAKAGRWRDHLRGVYPDDADHIERWLAQRVQHPGIKINHALVLGGGQGIGKDTLLEPVKHAVGPWNWSEIGPQNMLGRFNGWVASVVVRVSEVRDLGDMDRFSFYDHAKTYIAAPPDVLRVDEKNTKEYAVFNVLGMILTSNHKTDGIYLPPDDRRHYVAWSELDRSGFSESYWRDLWNWYGDGGIWHVVAFLKALDLSGFDPKAPPPKTEAWHAVVMANHAPEDMELADAIERAETPQAITLDILIAKARANKNHNLIDDLQDRKHRRAIPHKLERVGYVALRNKDAKDGLWTLNGKRQAVYVNNRLSVRERHLAAKELPMLLPMPPAVSAISAISGFASPPLSVPPQTLDHQTMTEAWALEEGTGNRSSEQDAKPLTSPTPLTGALAATADDTEDRV